MRKNLLPVATLTVLALTVPTVAYAGGKHKPKPEPTPVISVDSDPQCAGFSLTALFDGKKPKAGTYEVTAQGYDSETVTPVGEELVFSGSIRWGETVTVEIDPATDYLLWTYRVDAVNSPKAKVVYGERQLDCRPDETPEPEPEPEPGVARPWPPICDAITGDMEYPRSNDSVEYGFDADGRFVAKAIGDRKFENYLESGWEVLDGDRRATLVYTHECEQWDYGTPETPETPEVPEVEVPEVEEPETPEVDGPTTGEVVTEETTDTDDADDVDDAPAPVVATPSFTG